MPDTANSTTSIAACTGTADRCDVAPRSSCPSGTLLEVGRSEYASLAVRGRLGRLVLGAAAIRTRHERSTAHMDQKHLQRAATGGWTYAFDA